MNIELVRNQFKKYRAVIEDLENQLCQAKNDAEQNYWEAEERASRAREQARRAENARIDAERQAESDRWYRESEIRRITSDLDRARSWGDSWAERQAIDKLKRLS